MHINELQYGNPSIDIITHLNESSILDNLFPAFANAEVNGFPYNDSNIVRNELNELVEKSAVCQHDPLLVQRYQRYDVSLLRFYDDVMFDDQEEKKIYSQLVLDVFRDVLPLVFKLKFHYQRPRPFQLARYLKLKLYPFYSTSSDSPSFPSLHACLSKVLAGVLSNTYTTATKYFNDTAVDIGASRLYLGLNFPSSVQTARVLADQILVHPEFQKKYKL